MKKETPKRLVNYDFLKKRPKEICERIYECEKIPLTGNNKSGKGHKKYFICS